MPQQRNRPSQILFASLVGTTIEFFDFYIYATAAVLVFPTLFFPDIEPAAALLASLATFAIAFIARPIGSAVFGHFGDRIGRKATLVAALLTMGLSTVAIGVLPTYASIGIFAPLLLALCRFGQGLGLGGEWGGAVLLATENAPPGKKAWYGMFPQLGAPIGFLLSGGAFLLLSRQLTESQFLSFGWRMPFVGSAVLMLVGLYVRLHIHETPEFSAVIRDNTRVKMPLLVVFRDHWRIIIGGILTSLSAFVLFYLMTVFTLSWGTTKLGFSREEFLIMQLLGIVCFGITIPLAGKLAQFALHRTLLLANLGIMVFGLVMGALFMAGTAGIMLMLVLGLSLMGLSYGPLGTLLSELFPTRVRYTGSSIAFNGAGIFGASLAPYIATWLATHQGVDYVGYYLTVAGCLTLVGLWMVRENKFTP